jgi:hypothetical protein
MQGCHFCWRGQHRSELANAAAAFSEDRGPQGTHNDRGNSLKNTFALYCDVCLAIAQHTLALMKGDRGIAAEHAVCSKIGTPAAPACRTGGATTTTNRGTIVALPKCRRPLVL